VLFQTSVFSNSIILTERQICDFEMLANEGFAPLDGFLNKEDYENVLKEMRLKNGSLWPIPIVLDIDRETSQKIKIDDEVYLKNEDGLILGSITVKDMWMPDKKIEAESIYGTLNKEHPGVDYLLSNTKDFYIGGPIKVINFPPHYDFKDLRKSPKELKNFFKEKGITKVVAFQTRNPLHKAHVALTQIAANQTNAHLLINPVVGKTKPGDIGAYARVRCYRKILNHFPKDTTHLSVLPLAMRMAGPKEALWHAIIRKNYGCTHFIVGRDHAGPGKDSKGVNFYDIYEAQNIVKKHSKEIGIELVALSEVAYVKNLDKYLPVTEVPVGSEILQLSGTEFRRRLTQGLEIPSWLSFSEIIDELRIIHPPVSKQGATIFFTGLSGAGKSTIANALSEKLSEIQYRKITINDIRKPTNLLVG
jgi:sulfate adenylyltransferase